MSNTSHGTPDPGNGIKKELAIMNRKVLMGVGVIAGVVQAMAGVVMYLAGVYFAPWSIIVSLFLLLVCIVVGARWYTAHCLNGEINYFQALSVGIAISVSTGLVYAVYNMVSISWFYPHFLDELVRARLDPAVVHQGKALSRSLLCEQRLLLQESLFPISFVFQ
jgi:uncharacterized protein DUF4199